MLDQVGAGFHRIGIGLREGWIVLAPAIDGNSIDPENLPDVGKRVALTQQVEGQQLAPPGRQASARGKLSRNRSGAEVAGEIPASPRSPRSALPRRLVLPADGTRCTCFSDEDRQLQRQ
jgi:hypothetical protein